MTNVDRFLIFLPATLYERVMTAHVVCPSVTLIHADHISTRIISPVFHLFADITSAI